MNDISCRNVGSHWALEQAKYNLVNEYLLVGVTEELEDFVMMLEAALPRFFRGATELYRTGTVPETPPCLLMTFYIDFIHYFVNQAENDLFVFCLFKAFFLIIVSAYSNRLICILSLCKSYVE